MTVQELIDYLETCDPHAMVVTSNDGFVSYRQIEPNEDYYFDEEEQMVTEDYEAGCVPCVVME